MELTNEKIIAIMPALADVATSEVKFPASVSYKIIRNIKVLNDFYTDINMARSSIIAERYEPVVGELGTFVPKEGQRELAEKELEDLYNVTNNIEVQTFPISVIEGLDVPLKVMNAIHFMIED